MTIQSNALGVLVAERTFRRLRTVLFLVLLDAAGVALPASAASPAPASPPELKAIEAIHPAWLDGVADYRLPSWYERWRVHAHTRLGPPMHDRPLFLEANTDIARLGFHVLGRHMKTGKEGAWWPSKVGGVEEWAKERNVAGEIIRSAHNAGLRLIAYHRHMEDLYMVRQHPDWGCVDAEGKPLSSRRGQYMCWNSPYIDYFIQRQLELVDMGVDGFFYDEVHMPKLGCWCQYCRERFKTEAGLEHPRKDDPSDPAYRKLIDFNNATVERAFLKMRATLHRRNPELVMLIGSNTYPGMSDRHLTHRLFRIADSMKTEYDLANRLGNNRIFVKDATLKRPEADLRMAQGWTLSRDAADGRPAHVWTPRLTDAASAVFATAGIITYGNIANLDNEEKSIPNPGLFKKAVDLGNKVSPAFAGARPVRWALVHHAEDARDQLLPNEAAAWREVLYPAYGAFAVLTRHHLPVGFITDSQLEEGRFEDSKVLFIPAPARLTTRMRAAVQSFKAGGGLVVEQREGWQWHDPNEGQEAAMAAFWNVIEQAAQAAPVQAFGDSPRMHAVAFAAPGSKRLTVSLCNEFSWVNLSVALNPEDAGARSAKSGAGKYSKGKDGGNGKASPAPAKGVAAVQPPPCEGIRIVLRGQAGPRRVTDFVTGQPLAFTAKDGAVEIKVPNMEVMAVVVAEY